MLLPAVVEPDDREALSGGEGSVSYRELRAAASALASRLAGHRQVALWATPTVATCIGVVGVLQSGAAAVPVNPRIGSRELEHVVADSEPSAVVAEPGADLPGPLAVLPRFAPDPEAAAGRFPPEPDGEAAAFVFYTSGTTGPPKGVVVPRRAVASNLDALASVWRWTPDDVLTHGLPLFHVHGLVLGVLGPLRVGSALRYPGPFSPEAVCRELDGGATMLFGVPTMYADLADLAETKPPAAEALGRARLLVSGSAALATRDFDRIERLTGQAIAERYGLTETLMDCAVPAGERRPGSVGPPLPGVGVEVRDDDERAVDPEDARVMGEVWVRGPNVFRGYLNRPDATAEAMRDGWFRTGDLATRDADGFLRIVGRRATDLIKTGGYKVGAGEVEAALLEHPAVAEAAVTGEPDDRLGQRIVAWVVLRAEMPAPTPRDLEDHVAVLLAPDKRPRTVRFVEALPRNEMGKVRKTALASPA